MKKAKAPRGTMPADVRKQIVAEARKAVDVVTDGKDLVGMCVYNAFAVCLAAGKRGMRLVPQAGTAGWPRMPLEDDDGKETTLTHFSYVWTNSNVVATIKETEHGPKLVLPEIHVWAGHPEKQELIDLTTRDLPKQCVDTAGLPWTAPDFFWGRELPKGWAYEPSFDATSYAVELVRTKGILDDLASALGLRKR